MKRIALVVSLLMLTGALSLYAQKAANMPNGKKFYIQSAMNYGSNNGGYWDIPGVFQPNNPIKKGANIQVWNLDPHHDRQFTLVSSSINGYYEIQIGYTRSSRVDIDNGRADNGTNVKVWERNGNDAQKFKFHHLGNGRFKIYDRNGKILCLKGRKNSNGTNVHIWNDHDGSSVEWYLIDVDTKRAYIPRDKPTGRPSGTPTRQKRTGSSRR
ncbi:MAG: RICIN domain-containing protein [Perlabentimonas sp.]